MLVCGKVRANRGERYTLVLVVPTTQAAGSLKAEVALSVLVTKAHLVAGSLFPSINTVLLGIQTPNARLQARLALAPGLG